MTDLADEVGLPLDDDELALELGAPPANWQVDFNSMLQVYDMLDKDKKGYLTFEDAESFFYLHSGGAGSGDESNEAKVKELYEAVDKNKDGKLQKHEFCQYFFDFQKAKERYVADLTKVGAGKKYDPCTIYCRIRPNSTDGVGGHNDSGESSGKKLDTFDANKVVVSGKTYKFGTEKFEKGQIQSGGVLMPEASQEEVYKKFIQDKKLFEAWCERGRNVLLFAYGQTGTGKTHTMFGSDESLKAKVPLGETHPDWGIFPRLINNVFKLYKDMDVDNTFPGSTFCITISAFQFYHCMMQDLLSTEEQKKQYAAATGEKEVRAVPCDWDKVTKRAVGLNARVLSSPTDIGPLVEEIYGNRAVSSTKMNAQSSRGHTCLIISLHQYSPMGAEEMHAPPHNYCVSTFTLCDLAGAERPTKAGGDRVGGIEIAMMMTQGKKLPQGAEATIINMELSSLSTTTMFAAEAYRANKPFKNIAMSPFPMDAFIANAYQDGSICNVLLCLSQASQNGWETWFSCEMGAKMGNLITPGKEFSPLPTIFEVYKKHEKALKDAQVQLQRTDPKVPAQAKYLSQRMGRVNEKTGLLEVLKIICPGVAEGKGYGM